MSQQAGLVPRAAAGEALGVEAVPDEDLLRRRDAHSFAVLYQRHLPSLYRYLLRRLASREDAEDVANDVFQRAWRSRDLYGGQGSVRAWLFAIGRRLLADHYRRGAVTPVLEPDAGVNLQDHQPPLDESVIHDELTRQVGRLVQQLSTEQREILRLRFTAELTYAEIAFAIGKSEDAVKKTAYRALETLRRGITDG
jgi:RNA polymerase sigma-70 factor (ECF subfamily)